MSGINQSVTQSSARGFAVGSFLRFLASSVIAGLALAFVIMYLWPSIGERLSRQPEESDEEPMARVSYADAVIAALPAHPA